MTMLYFSKKLLKATQKAKTQNKKALGLPIFHRQKECFEVWAAPRETGFSPPTLDVGRRPITRGHLLEGGGGHRVPPRPQNPTLIKALPLPTVEALQYHTSGFQNG